MLSLRTKPLERCDVCCTGPHNGSLLHAAEPCTLPSRTETNPRCSCRPVLTRNACRASCACCTSSARSHSPLLLFMPLPCVTGGGSAAGVIASAAAGLPRSIPAALLPVGSSGAPRPPFCGLPLLLLCGPGSACCSGRLCWSLLPALTPCASTAVPFSSPGSCTPDDASAAPPASPLLCGTLGSALSKPLLGGSPSEAGAAAVPLSGGTAA